MNKRKRLRRKRNNQNIIKDSLENQCNESYNINNDKDTYETFEKKVDGVINSNLEEIKDEINEDIKRCSIETLDVKVINNACNEFMVPDGKEGFFVIKVPVVLSQMKLQISCVAKTELNEIASNIIRVNKNVYLTEYKLLVESKKIFINGFIRESIEYTAIDCERDNEQLKNMILNIPFKTTADVKYFITPSIISIHKSDEMIKNKELKECETEKVFEEHQYYNEEVYCEPVEVNSEIIIFKKLNSELKNKNGFNEIIQHITLNLTIKLIQEQTINVCARSKLNTIEYFIKEKNN